MPDHSKRFKHKLLEYARTAYERELNHELARLDSEFAHWREGRLSGPELTERIHRFHNGAARDLYKRYTYGQVDLVVAHAIVSGPLNRDEIDAQTLTALAPALAAFQHARDNATGYDPVG